MATRYPYYTGISTDGMDRKDEILVGGEQLWYESVQQIRILTKEISIS